MRLHSALLVLLFVGCGVAPSGSAGTGGGKSSGTGGGSAAGSAGGTGLGGSGGESAGGTGGGSAGATGGGVGGSAGGSGGTGGGSGASFNGVTTGNPFAGTDYYLNPDYAAKVQTSVVLSPANATMLNKLKQFPTAVWLDSRATIPSVTTHLDAALALQNSRQKPVTTVFVVYDLPNRDCAAKASNGELFVDQNGLALYKTQYIDPIAAAFKAHPTQRIVAVIEPDSLANIATNLNQPRCAASEAAYREGVAYAIKTLNAPNVYLYIDAAHSGWLGWPANQTASAAIFKQVLDAAGGVNLIRGFATNVANYTVLQQGVPELFDYQGNPCHDELTFVAQISTAFTAAGMPNKTFIIDTSRNGRGGIRRQWGYWCNNIGAGLGERPRADPVARVDAYFWVKPPGESDGTSDPTAVRYDTFCGMEDAAKPAPEAGQWFHTYLLSVAMNANPAL